ncbi:nuclease-related domain-containing protein [Demequina sediminicola]|uniref:nuclease-related domain-containing protein n=1 Tax=Demequina sediminicola TaxID=1095026 RepID=UPI000A6F657F|nr:nuclease-related domain-containing protein [Demequina sediminicola]
MTALEATRWKRYGHDRLYFSTFDGEKVGHLNLNTGDYQDVPDDLLILVESVAHDWCLRNEVAPPGVPLVDSGVEASVPDHTPLSEPDDTEPLQASAVMEPQQPPAPDQAPAAAPIVETEPGWIDLASNLPGHGLRIEAAAEWEAAKSRSKIAAYANRYVFKEHTQERAWRAGAEGEEYVGARLNKLRDKGCRVLHSVPVGTKGSDIDHVVIGPGGVYTVNTKNHSGKKIWVAKYQMRVDGSPVPYLRNSRHEASRAKRLLESHVDFDVPVLGCVVVLTGSFVPEVTYKQQPDDVRILDKWDVPRWFKRRARILEPAQVDHLFEVARRSTTWTE